MKSAAPPKEQIGQRTRELAALFLRLDATAFGGPAAHVAMMHDQVGTRRAWLTDQAFLDLNSATNLIPGLDSTKLAIHIRRRGSGGFFARDVVFIFLKIGSVLYGSGYARLAFCTTILCKISAGSPNNCSMRLRLDKSRRDRF